MDPVEVHPSEIRVELVVVSPAVGRHDGILAGAPVYAGGMNIVHLTDEELEMARHGMTAYLRSFGHDEADTHVRIRAVLARLAAAQPEQDPSAALD
jgi:hypothetical protein